MQVEVVGHHRRPNDPDGQHEHLALRKHGHQEGAAHFREAGLRLRQDENLDEVANADGGHQDQDDRLDDAHPHAAQAEQQQHVEGGDEDGPEEGNVKEKVERHGAAENLG